MTISEQTQIPDSETEDEYRVDGNRLAAGTLLQCWIRERSVELSVAAGGDESGDAGTGRSSLRLKLRLVNPQTTSPDLDELVGPTGATGAAEDRP